MIALRLPVVAAVIAGAICAADGEVDKAALRLDLVAAKAPKTLAMEMRMRGAEALRERHPELAKKFVDQTLSDLRSGKDWVVGYGVIQGLAQVSPNDALSILPNLVPGYEQLVIASLAQSRRTKEATDLYLNLLHKGQMRPAAASAILGPLMKQDPAKGVKFFEDVLATIVDPPEPADAAWVVNAAVQVAAVSPKAATDAIEWVMRAASKPDYGSLTSPVMLGNFTVGSKTVSTTKTRDTLLLLSAARLKTVAPERLEEHKIALSAWDLSGSIVMRSVSYRAATPPAQPGETRAVENSITQRIGQIRGKATDAERAELVIAIARDIRSLPAGQSQVSLSRSLANLSTEGALGNEALTAVAATLGQAMRESFPSMVAAKQVWAYGDAWIELAKLVRYEHVAAPFSDPSLDAAGALLELRERVQQENGFTLTSLDGKTYTLEGLKGRVVLLNFWATWCPPCRKEMPDMEKLYREYETKGLTVLAVSDEDRETVQRFLEKTPYTFPILLDTNRTVNTAFMVEGIPKSFLFDREGRLAAQAVDMRTEQQFREMLKLAGLE